MSSRLNLYRFSNMLAYVVVVAVNSIAGAVGINGLKTGDVSNRFDTLIAPAGYVFGIWGVIYLLLLGYVIYQFSSRRSWAGFQSKIGPLFIVSCIINVCWLLLWHYLLITASLALMLGLLLTLITIYIRLGVGLERVGLVERLFVHLPFSVYLGWITVATIANVAATLVFLGHNQIILGAVNWTILVIAVAVAITGVVLWTRRDVAYAAVLVWALVGVYVRQAGMSSLPYLALAGAAVVGILATIVIFRGRAIMGIS